MRNRSIGSRILSLLMVAALVVSVAAIPVDVHAAAKKSKVKATITIHNANSDTVIKKGKKLKLSVSAVSSNGKKVKIKYKSLNKKIATVSKKGVIKAKKKGSAKIRVYAYVSGKKRGSKPIKIRVGTPATGVSVSGAKYIRAGRSTSLKASVSPSNSTNKKVIWASSNPNVVTVDGSGKITGRGNGSATITAYAADGSGVCKSVAVYSHKYTKNDTNWIAHRGLHDTVPENTADAFRRAGQAGFWGAECDIWETRHVQTEIVTQDAELSAAPDESSDITAPEEQSADAQVQEDENPADQMAETSQEINAAELSEAENIGEPGAAQDGETASDETAELELSESLDAKSAVVESFDIVINHDSTFNRVFGVNSKVKDMTAEQIRANSKLARVCFFSEYLDICKQYNMIPVIEIKDYNMSDAGIAKFCDMVYDKGLMERAQFISFDANVLERAQNYIISTYEYKPYTGYLIGGGDVTAAVNRAKELNFTGINIAYTVFTGTVNKQCRDLGLKVCTWTYGNSSASDEALYKQIISGAFNVYSATTDVKYF